MKWKDPVQHPDSNTDGKGRFDFGGPIVFEGEDAFTHSGFTGRTSALTEYKVWRSLRTTTHRYVVSENGSEELYDLSRL